MSGYPSRDESEHDVVENSHASTGLSWADGIARAFQLRGEDDRHVVTVVGDGALTGAGDDFLADYARLGAQRNAKIVGIFVRLCQRDGKPRYLSLIPRVWALMERDLAHPALAPVARWFDANIPADLRASGGGSWE